ncbi:MAG: ABC transporter substrate-binding protein [Candidatus Hodarchaeota archaeon]
MKFLKIRRFRAHKKSLIAAGIIGVVAIAGIIAGVYFFIKDLYHSHDYIVPGVPSPGRSDRIIKIGLLDDMNHISGDHAWKGAYLAAEEINEKGGILINGDNYYIGLIAENTNEVYGELDEGVIAAKHMIKYHHPHFITGGFEHWAIDPYLEVIMEKKIPFLTTGDMMDQLCQKVLDDYQRYKYLFRIMPINNTGIFINIFCNIVSLANHLNLTYGGTVDKIAFLYEYHPWATSMIDGFKDNLPYNIVAEIPFPLNESLADFETYWNQIEAAEAQITLVININRVHQLGILIAQHYKAVKPQSLLFNLHLLPQTPSYWDDAEGACQYEIFMQPIHNTSKTNLTKPFFNSFVREYGYEPFYTGVGSYDAVQLLAWAINDSQSFNSDTIVKTLEKINTSNPFTGVAGKLAFTPSHDLQIGKSFGHSLFCQYKYIDGTKVVIPSPLLYYDSIATGSLRLPYWGINGLLTDPPQPPKNFTLITDAETSDLDGEFNLNWTVFEDADNYSIYMSDNSFDYISKKFELFDYQTATPPYSMSLKKGEYYFRVVAYNETGETMSNEVHVSIPGPEPFSLTATPPDIDGKFDLLWIASEGAVNYSVFRYHKKITSINESLTCLANQTALSPFSITGLPNGKYYFAVAAYNEMGYTLSNCEKVVVQIFPWPIIFIVSISSLIGVASIGLGWRYFKHKAVKKSERERQEPIVVEGMKKEPLEGKKPEDKNK